MSAQQRRYYKQRYRSDPEYRRKMIESSLRWQREAKQDPIYKRLYRVRQRIVEVRNSYETLSRSAEKRFAQLQKLIEERDLLAEQWHAKREAA